MKAVALKPKQPGSHFLAELPEPDLNSVPGGRGVLVRVIRVGVDGTDKELLAGEYGAPPPGYDFLVHGHESFGRVEAVGDNVRGLRPGDYVVATVRRPGKSPYDRIGLYDFTTDDTYYEHGINLLHGFLTERYVDDPEYIVHVPAALKEVGVLLEPLSIVEKGIDQAYEVQRRMKIWDPRRALVMGAGSVGLLATMVLRLRGLDVTVIARSEKPYRNADMVEATGARYLATSQSTIEQAAKEHGPFDVILEATGSSAVAFECMRAVGKNGVLVLASVTGGDKKIEIPSDKINLEFVLGNKLLLGTVNANRSFFEQGVEDMALANAEWPGWLAGLITDRVHGLDRFQELGAKLKQKEPVKIVCEVSAE